MSFVPLIFRKYSEIRTTSTRHPDVFVLVGQGKSWQNAAALDPRKRTDAGYPGHLTFSRVCVNFSGMHT